MKNLWPEKFEEDQRVSPKSILEEQAKLLPSLTDGIVYAEVDEIEHPEFAFRFNILGKFIENYRFEVLRLFHDIMLYPVGISLDEGIRKELGLNPGGLNKIGSPEELENFLGLVLKSERLKKVIGSIIRLSR